MPSHSNHQNKFSSSSVKTNSRPRIEHDEPETASHFDTPEFHAYCETVLTTMKQINREGQQLITLGDLRRAMNGGNRNRWDLEALASLAQDGEIDRVSSIPPSKWQVNIEPRRVRTINDQKRGYNNKKTEDDVFVDYSAKIEVDGCLI